MSKEKTLILIKPDAFSRNLVGQMFVELEKTGLRLVGCKMVLLSTEEAKEFYRDHREKVFHQPLSEFMSSNPIMATVWEGDNAIDRAREMIGVSDPAKCKDTTIRKRFAKDGRFNVVHGSDSKESAMREVEFFFPEGDKVFEWEDKEYKL